MSSFLAFFVVFGILIVVHEFGHFIVAKLLKVRVDCFSIGFGPRILKRKGKETEYSLSLFPLGGYVKLAGDNLAECKGSPEEYYSKKPWERGLIIFFGAFLNYILGFLMFMTIMIVGYPTLGTRVGNPIPGYGAQAAGIIKGDRINYIDGKEVKTFEDVQMMIYEHDPEKDVKITLTRENKPLTFTVRLTQKQVDDVLGSKKTISLLGVEPDLEDTMKMRHHPLEAFIFSAQKTWDVTVLTYKSLWRIVTGKLSLKESVAGPLRIYDITSKAAKRGVVSVLNLIGFLSISLAVFNLLPFPVLDGGHLLLIGLEKLRGKALSMRMDNLLNRIGITALISLAVVVTFYDIVFLYGKKIMQLFIK